MAESARVMAALGMDNALNLDSGAPRLFGPAVTELAPAGTSPTLFFLSPDSLGV